MGVKQTSISAYRRLRKYGNEASQKERVLDVIRKYGPISDFRAAKMLGMYPSTVAARRNELYKKALIHFAGYKINPVTGIKSETWEVI